MKTHGMTFSSEFNIWHGMLSRCHNPNDKSYPRYGGRGIYVCDRWRNSFEDFYRDMGARPSKSHSIDRIDNDGPYNPENTRWATMTQQQRNTSRNHLLTHNGKTQTLTEWSIELGIHKSTISKRLGLYGMTPEEALTRPICRTVVIDGDDKTIRQLANDVGMSYSSMSRRIKDGVDLRKPKKEPARFEYDGKNLTVAEWADVTGISRAVLSSRLCRNKWDVKDALTTPVNQQWWQIL